MKTEILQLLKGATTAEHLARDLGISPAEVRDWQRRYLESKLPQIDGALTLSGAGPARICRDRWGVAHVRADTVEGGYFALGYSMAQDRLWQLDYFRRRASGRLAEILGPRFLGSDRLVRTIGLEAAAVAGETRMSGEVAAVLAALSQGINAAMEAALDNLPVEFELLDYAPEPWTRRDSIAVWKWRWWMLTGRLETIALAEACKRFLPPGPRAAFLAVEAGEETIVPGSEPASIGGSDTGEGSNNWVVGGRRTTSGKPVLASDPHNVLDHPSQWYEAQLKVPGLDAIGAFYLGTPGIYLGHTRKVAWGLTNHTASGRDLYAEQVHPADPARYREAGQWQPFEEEQQEIQVRGQEPEKLEIRRTVRGPLVDELIPAVEEGGNPPLSLRWVGAGPTTGFEAMLGLMRADSVDAVQAALSQWPFPNLNFVFADRAGRIGYHAVGTVPRRSSPWLGFRPADQAPHQWEGAWAFEELPHLVDPERGWVATANNPPWGGAGPYLALGNWSDGYRFQRIRERIEGQEKLSVDAVAAIQADVLHARARDLGPVVAAWAQQSDDAEIRRVGQVLEEWDGAYTVDAVGPALFEAFWHMWLERVARARFPAHVIGLVASRAGAVARQLLQGEDVDWFPAAIEVGDEVQAALGAALAWLRERVGPGPEEWRWGRVHQVRFPHPLGLESAALAAVLSPGPFETSGGTGTVRAAGFSMASPFAMTSGSTYRMVVDLADPARARSTTTGGSSGHPGSPHYADQTGLWLADEYHPLCMVVEEGDVEGTLELRPPE